MLRTLVVPAVLALAAALMAAPPPAAAQNAADWSPASTRMPEMPVAAEADAGWLRSVSSWFSGLDGVTGVSTADLRVVPEGQGRDGRARYLRFQSGHIPVVAWSDRSGDGRVDMVEVFNNGRLVLQVVDSDYSGRANVVRSYNRDGSLAGERRL